jgi:hypothetical protein
MGQPIVAIDFRLAGLTPYKSELSDATRAADKTEARPVWTFPPTRSETVLCAHQTYATNHRPHSR